IGISYGFSYKADYFFIVNNDTEIKKEIISKLIDYLKQNEKIGIIAPTITFKKKNKTLFDLGGYINKITGKTFHDNKRIVVDKNVLFPDYVSGCCILVPRKIFEKVGLFDERFFLYYEDVDLCLRVKEKGFVIALDPTVVISHALSQSVGKVSKVSFYHQTFSALEFGHKYFSSWKRISNICFIVLQSGVFLIKAPFAGFAAFEAIVNYALGRKKSIQN
ncbi:MAG TPA: glycosyltransferase family 2 protein, partial [Patescibacteria group bacterium]